MILKNLSWLVLAATILGSMGCASRGMDKGQTRLQSRRAADLDRLNEQAGMPDEWQGQQPKRARIDRRGVQAVQHRVLVSY